MTVNKNNEVTLYFHFVSTFATLAVKSFGLKSNSCCSIELD